MIHRFLLPLELAREPQFDVPIVVFQSDDWGHGCVRSRDMLAALLPEAVDPATSGWFRDARECVADVQNLADVLLRFRDRGGRPPCFTLNFIVHEPDFAAIEAQSFARYVTRPECDLAVVAAVADAASSHGVFEAALHGAEHVAPGHWLRELRSGNAELRGFFDARAMPPPGLIAGYPGLGAAYLPSPHDAQSIPKPKDRLEQALTAFARIFGYPASGFVAPNHAWDHVVEVSLSRRNVDFLQAAHVRYPDVSAIERNEWIRERSGPSGNGDLWYQTRNLDFEPAVHPGRVDMAIERGRLLTKRGVPIVVNTHRVNYVGGIDPEAAARARIDLGRLIEALLDARPDLCFMNSSELDRALRGLNPTVQRLRWDPIKRLIVDLAEAIFIGPPNHHREA